MGLRPWTDREREIVDEGKRAGRTYQATLDALHAAGFTDRSWNSVRDKQRSKVPSLPSAAAPAASPSAEEFSQEGGQDDQTLTSKSARISTPEALLAKAGVDLRVWEPYWQRVKQYEGFLKNNEGRPVVVPMFAVEVKIRRNKAASDLLALKAGILADLREHAPQFPAYRPVLYPSGVSRFLLELALFDKHFGKLAWKAETGEDYDLRIARDRARWAVETLLQRASSFPLERILFPIGNDAGQIDNAQGTTTRGTRVDADSRWFKIFRELRLFYQWAIDRCMEVAPVDVVVVPGNHDQQSVLALGEVLDAQYSRTDRVQVMGGPRLRKYYEYGSNMLLFTHGNEEKPGSLPLLMATEEPEMWARTKYREAHTGHFHRKKETQFVGVDEHNGVRVRILSSLAATDAWHASQGYTQNWRAAEAFVWDHSEGLVGNFSANLGPYPEDDGSPPSLRAMAA